MHRCGATPADWTDAGAAAPTGLAAEKLLQRRELFFARTRLGAGRAEAETGSGGRAALACRCRARCDGGVLGSTLRRVARTGAGGLLALGLARGTTAAEAGARDRTHARNLRHAAAGDRLHHLRSLLEPLHELVDVGHRHAGALRDAQAPGAVQQLGIAALRRRHRLDDRLGAHDLALVEVLELLLHAAGTRKHAEHLLDR